MAITVALPSVDDDNYDVQLQRTLVKLFADINKAVSALQSLPGAVSASAVPSTGTHKAKEFVWNTNLDIEYGAIGSRYILAGWVCISGGTPGTWRECRFLTGN